MRYALIYGAFAVTIIIAVITASLSLDLPSHASSEWFGYLVMLATLSILVVGVKRFRDVECGGVVSFGRAFAVGTGIALVATLFYIIGWEVYLAASGWDFMTEYGTPVLERMRAGEVDPAAIAAKEAELRQIADRYRDPLFRVPVTAVEILPLGLLIALLSAAVIRNPRVLPARR